MITLYVVNRLGDEYVPIGVSQDREMAEKVMADLDRQDPKGTYDVVKYILSKNGFTYFE